MIIGLRRNDFLMVACERNAQDHECVHGTPTGYLGAIAVDVRICMHFFCGRRVLFATWYPKRIKYLLVEIKFKLFSRIADRRVPNHTAHTCENQSQLPLVYLCLQQISGEVPPRPPPSLGTDFNLSFLFKNIFE